MSWPHRHMTEFVIPEIRTLVWHGDRPLTAADIKPYDGRIRPASNCKYEEVGLLYSSPASTLPKTEKAREPLLAMCRTLDANSLVGTRTSELGARFSTVPPGDVVHAIIWNSLRKLRKLIRCHGVILVLPGRDVWPWEVIARQRRFSSVFDSMVSRTVAGNHPALRKVIGQWQVPNLDKSLVFDTGFNGSIHSEICRATQKKPLSMILSANDRERQIFKGHTAARAKALAIEYFPKDFQRATTNVDEAYQALAALEESIKTALLTIWLWHHVSPAHIESAHEPRPKLGSVKMKMKTGGTGPYVFNDDNTTGGGALYLNSAATWDVTTTPTFITGGGNISINNFSASTSVALPAISLKLTAPGEMSYVILIKSPNTGLLVNKLMATWAGSGGLRNPQMVENIQDLAAIHGQDAVKEVIAAKFESDALKKELATHDPQKLQAFAAKVPASMVQAAAQSQTPAQKLVQQTSPPIKFAGLPAQDDFFVAKGPNFVDPETFELK